MKLYKISVITTLLFVLLLPGFVRAALQFSFSTEEQNIPIGELSKEITVHSETPVSETTYITFTSSSNTGQFFSNTTNTTPIVPGSYVYISSKNSNRTVYYKDTTAGSFVLTAKIFNKEKTDELSSVTQNISIGTSVQEDDSSQDTTSFNTAEEGSQATSNSTQNTSAHSSPAPLSSMGEKVEFEISAGRNRLTAVGNDLVFRVTLTKSSNILESGITYLWSFGDGSTTGGSSVSHSYRFPGDYSVIVNASYSDKQAVSRTAVKVVLPEVSMRKINGGIEITNNSGVEINLGGWKLTTPLKVFTFPPDTLISNKKSVVFSDIVTGISGEVVQLFNPIRQEFAHTGIVSKVKEELPASNTVDEISVLEKKIGEVKRELALVTRNQPIAEDPLVLGPVGQVLGDYSEMDNVVSHNEIQSPETVVFEAEKKTGLVGRIFAWPISGFEFVRRLFVED